HRVTLIGDMRASQASLCSQFTGILDIQIESLEGALRSPAGPSTVVCIDLIKETRLLDLKEWLKHKPAQAKAIFITDKASHLENTRALAIGATDVLHQPLDGRALLTKLWGDVEALSADPNNAAIRKSPAVSTAVDTLRSIFSSACFGE